MCVYDLVGFLDHIIVQDFYATGASLDEIMSKGTYPKKNSGTFCIHKIKLHTFCDAAMKTFAAVLLQICKWWANPHNFLSHPLRTLRCKLPRYKIKYSATETSCT